MDPLVAAGGAAVVGANTDEELLALLEKRGKLPPPKQRELFVAECALGGDAAAQLSTVVSAAAERPAITVVSANLYYGQCTTPGTGEQAIDPARSFAAVEALFAAGADVVCMQEVVGAQDTGIPGGKDSYDFDFFPKEAFAPWPEEAAAFEARAGVKFLFGAAENSTMYRHSFGNAIAVKTSTLNVVDSKVQACLTAPTEAEGMEGRAAVTIVVQPVGGGGKLTVCCTHLTEKVVGEQGQKQSEMIESLLQGTLSDPAFAQYPTVLCGDFNINDVGGGMPPKSAAYCKASPFLHPHPDYDPYTRLAGAGFASAASAASAEGRSLHTCWNGGIVDYMGGRNGAVPLAFGCVSPTHNGQVVSDHRWPVGVYQFP